MELKFKPLNFDFNEWDIENLLTIGAYFEHGGDQYLIKIKIEDENSSIIQILIKDNDYFEHYNFDHVKNGDIGGFWVGSITLLCTIEASYKYFFPVFSSVSRQLYYDIGDDHEYVYRSYQITSLMECINFALEYNAKLQKWT